jgi:hypothetical protein
MFARITIADNAARLRHSVASKIAGYLTENDDAWDQLELPSIDDGDEAMRRGSARVHDVISCQKSGSCWIIDLPELGTLTCVDLLVAPASFEDYCKRKIEIGRCGGTGSYRRRIGRCLEHSCGIAARAQVR